MPPTRATRPLPFLVDACWCGANPSSSVPNDLIVEKSARSILLNVLALAGLDVRSVKTGARRLGRYIAGMPKFRTDLATFKRQQASSRDEFAEGKIDVRFENDEQGGTALGHYFHQDLLVARKIHARRPLRHVDVGSRVDGFVAHVAVFRPIEIIDIRPLENEIPNIVVREADLSAPLPPDLIDCCDSLSCLHALEHFGLGRYGDPISFEGYRAGFSNLHLILQPGGTLYFSVPMGPQRVEFNSQRVFSLPFLLQLISPLYRIRSFSYVDEKGRLNEDIDLEAASVGAVDSSFGCRYGCAIFDLVKR
jgi:hypothetical protein